VLSIPDDIHSDIIQQHKWVVRDHRPIFELALQNGNDAGETTIYLRSIRKVKTKAEGSS